MVFRLASAFSSPACVATTTWSVDVDFCCLFRVWWRSRVPAPNFRGADEGGSISAETESPGSNIDGALMVYVSRKQYSSECKGRIGDFYAKMKLVHVENSFSNLLSISAT